MQLAITSVLFLAAAQALSPLRLSPKWREFMEEVLEEAQAAELNIFGKPVDEAFTSLPKLNKKTIT